ncbi:telomere-binding protein 1 [Trypanosoma grayi]|uniref:telomere-binding protein 1 n=1 Tax=Trypanosoma grayi TaxID=71804 RepID=UPI0004F4BBFA|nr:telomere-binding protein 1 [Trypanosoma grayi]KEG07781.1 telomere-binding protein 1 [Trypanosoma grayi]
MDRGDFDFPPDPAAEGFDSTVDAINNVPLRVLSNTPIEQLPPTILPVEQQRPIRQVMRGSRQLRRIALQRTQSHLSTQSLQGTDATQQAANAEDAEPTPPLQGMLAGHKRARFDWTEEELRDFYKFLSQYGTDFNAIAVLYPGRSRNDVKRLYHRELRKRRDDVRAALESREEIDLSTFKARLKKREELQQGPARRLDQEEEEALRQIEAGMLQLLPTPGEGETLTSDAANADFEFDFIVEERPQAEGAHVAKEDEEPNVKGDDAPIPVTLEVGGVKKDGGEAPAADTLLGDLVGLDEPFEDDFFEY